MEVAKSGGIHVSEPCLSPSLGWLSPTKISSSTDFDALHAQDASHENAVKERSNDRDSMSEFEFAMSAIKHENMHGEHMLAADELFFKGKLLPLYNPNYTDGSEQHVSGCDMRNQVNHQILPNHPTSPCSLYITDAENPQAITRDFTAPISPKAPKCSIMLRELFGLKKMAKSLCACTASGEVTVGSSCKSSRCGSKKGKAAKNKQKASLVSQVNASPAICKARHLSCVSTDADCTAEKARNSVSEPLLKCRVTQLGCPQDDQDNTALSAACTNAFDAACKLNRVSDSICTHKDSHEQRLLGNLSDEEDPHEQSAGSMRQSMQIGQGKMSLDKSSGGVSNCEANTCLGLPGAQNRGFAPPPVGMRLGDMSCEENTCRTFTREQSSELTRMRLCQLNPDKASHSLPSFEGSTCREIAGKQNRGSRRVPPMQVALGESSSEWIPLRNLSYREKTCRELTTDQSRGAMRRLQMRRHTGETSPERGSGSGLNAMVSQASRYATSEVLKSTEISRTKSLERSSSYSPKSLQRKYEQLKAIRQREGWRMLERSSSYNSGIHSMRVAPVLNVPIVCMSRSKSSNHGMHTRRKA